MSENIHDIIARRKAARRGDYSDEGVADKLDGILSNVETVGQDIGEEVKTSPVMTNVVEVNTDSSEAQTHDDVISESVGVLAIESSTVAQPTRSGRGLFGDGAVTELAHSADDPIQTTIEPRQVPNNARLTTAEPKVRILNTPVQLLNRRTGEPESSDTITISDEKPLVGEKASESRFGSPLDASTLLDNLNEVNPR